MSYSTDPVEDAERHISAEQRYSDAVDAARPIVVDRLIADRDFAHEFLTEEMCYEKPCIPVSNYPRLVSPAELIEHMLKPTNAQASHELLKSFRAYFEALNAELIQQKSGIEAVDSLRSAA